MCAVLTNSSQTADQSADGRCSRQEETVSLLVSRFSFVDFSLFLISHLTLEKDLALEGFPMGNEK